MLKFLISAFAGYGTWYLISTYLSFTPLVGAMISAFVFWTIWLNFLTRDHARRTDPLRHLPVIKVFDTNLPSAGGTIKGHGLPKGVVVKYKNAKESPIIFDAPTGFWVNFGNGEVGIANGHRIQISTGVAFHIDTGFDTFSMNWDEASN